MKIGGIIAEYNPFHQGHAYHIAQTKRQFCSHLVVAMSGNFVQRGQLACFSKWARAEVAVQSGADLVVELPTPIATAPATDFALGGVDLLSKLGVSVLSFGSEQGNVESLKRLLQQGQLAEQHPRFATLLETGIGHPKARSEMVKELFGEQAAIQLQQPNNLLGVEYLRAIETLGVAMEGVTISRLGVDHDQMSGQEGIASASYLRQLLSTQGVSALAGYVPETAQEIYLREVQQGKAPVEMHQVDRLLLLQIRRSSLEDLLSIDGMMEGIAQRILKQTVNCHSFEGCVEQVYTKRYTKARIRRILLHLLLEQKSDTYPKISPYIRVLAMNQKGQEILKQVDTEQYLLSTRFSVLAKQQPTQALFETRATDLYSLCSPVVQPVGREYTQPVIIK